MNLDKVSGVIGQFSGSMFLSKKIFFFFTQNFRTGRFSGILQIIWENLGLKNIFFDDVFVNFEQQKQLLKKLRKVSSKNDTQYILTPIKK